jgi:hypothetical protein
MGNTRAENWRDPAGLDPETGQPWRVCDMVGKLEQTLGRAHQGERAAIWQEQWDRLDDTQRSQYRQARGRRPRKRH